MAFQHFSKSKILAEIDHIHIPVEYKVCSLQDPHKMNIVIDKRNGAKICKKCKRKIHENEKNYFHFHIQIDCKIVSFEEANTNPTEVYPSQAFNTNPSHTTEVYPSHTMEVFDPNYNPYPNHTTNHSHSTKANHSTTPNQKDSNVSNNMIANQFFYSNKIISFLCFNQSHFYSTRDRNEILNKIWKGELFWIWMKQKDINSLTKNLLVYHHEDHIHTKVSLGYHHEDHTHTKVPSFVVSKLVPAFDDVQNLLLNKKFTSNLNQLIPEKVELDLLISQDSELNETFMFESTEDFDEREITERLNSLQFQSQSQLFDAEPSGINHLNDTHNDLKEEWYLNWESFKKNTFSDEIPSTPEPSFHKFAIESNNHDLFIPPSDDEEQEDVAFEELPSTQQLCNILLSIDQSP